MTVHLGHAGIWRRERCIDRGTHLVLDLVVDALQLIGGRRSPVEESIATEHERVPVPLPLQLLLPCPILPLHVTNVVPPEAICPAVEKGGPESRAGARDRLSS